MNDRDQNDNEPTVQLPRLRPVQQAEEFDPESTVVVEDWSQVPLPAVSAKTNE